MVAGRPNGPFPKLPPEELVEKWQKSFFYVRNVNPALDCINLPPFVKASQIDKRNWSYNPKNPTPEIVNICTRIQVITAREGLMLADVIAAFIARRVLSFPARPLPDVNQGVTAGWDRQRQAERDGVTLREGALRPVEPCADDESLIPVLCYFDPIPAPSRVGPAIAIPKQTDPRRAESPYPAG